VSRRTLAIAIIAVWVAGLVYLYARTTNRTPDEALAEAGLHVSPATYYYTLEQGGKQVGAASSAIDTTNSRVVATTSCGARSLSAVTFSRSRRGRKLASRAGFACVTSSYERMVTSRRS
jgi:hypothetical protein